MSKIKGDQIKGDYGGPAYKQSLRLGRLRSDLTLASCTTRSLVVCLSTRHPIRTLYRNTIIVSNKLLGLLGLGSGLGFGSGFILYA